MNKKVSIIIATVLLLIITNRCINQTKPIEIDKSDEIALIEKLYMVLLDGLKTRILNCSIALFPTIQTTSR